jgi:hypothetical protein
MEDLSVIIMSSKKTIVEGYPRCSIGINVLEFEYVLLQIGELS